MNKIVFSPAILLFFCILIITSCSKDDDSNNNNNTSTCSDGVQNGDETGVDCGGSCPACTVTPPVITISDPVQAYYELDGVPVHYVVGGSVSVIWGSSRSINGSGTSYLNSSSSAVGTWLTNQAGFNLYIGDEVPFTGSSIPPDPAFDSVFTIGPRNYTNKAINGVNIIINLAGGKTYRAMPDSNSDQTGSNFEITDVTHYYAGSDRAAKIRAEFNCKLYDDNNVEHTITNGVCVMTFANVE